MRTFFTLTFLSISGIYFAQETVIDTVKIIDRHLRDSEKTQQILRISSENFEKNSTNLSDVLRFQSPVFIKENGRGMVSSPSFRGTTAQQTAFVWNGINLNSVFLGQGDVNNLGLFGYDNIEVKSGGGSVIYGSGAIGGSVHLNNELKYNKGWKNNLFQELASYETYNSLFKTSFSDDHFSFNFSGAYMQSENDYEVPKKNYINRNGKYHNTTFSLGVARKLNNGNELFWQSHFYDGLQHYPISSENGNKTKYSTDNFRSLLGWNFNSSKIKNQLATVFIEEDFEYFANINSPKTSGGNGKSYIFKDDFNYVLNDKINLNFLSEFKQIEAEGFGSGIQNPKQKSGSLGLLLKYQFQKSFYFEGGIKKLWVEDYDTPILYSFGMKADVAPFYSIKLNASKNYRNPSFNDLYWQPGGNLNLKSETSYQAELGNVFQLKNFKFSATPYYIFIENMIQWLPTSGGYWAPQNVYKVRSLGVESQVNYRFNFGENHFLFNAGYIYTSSENKETHKQLAYVPFHKVFGSLNYDFNRLFGAYLQANFNGKTYTTTDESSKEALLPYFVLNGGLSYTFFKNFKLGFKMNNITNQVYETVSYYPLPMRNYAVNLNINF